MRHIVCYDVPDSRRRRRAAIVLEGFGERVQKSVFECELDDAALKSLIRALTRVLDPAEDKWRIVPMCAKDCGLMLSWGKKGRSPRACVV